MHESCCFSGFSLLALVSWNMTIFPPIMQPPSGHCYADFWHAFPCADLAFSHFATLIFAPISTFIFPTYIHTNPFKAGSMCTCTWLCLSRGSFIWFSQSCERSIVGIYLICWWRNRTDSFNTDHLAGKNS